MDIKENMQKEIRQNFQSAYKQRLLTMKNFYEMRYQTLHQTIANSYKKVLQDQILITMIKDLTTVTYIEDRVKQLFKQVIQNEREMIIQRLGLQFSQLKFHYQQLDKKFKSYEKQVLENNQKSHRQRINSQNQKSQISETLRKKDQQIYQIRLSLKQSQTIINQKQKVNKNYQEKIKSLISQNETLKTRIKQIQYEFKQVFGQEEKLKQINMMQSQLKMQKLQNNIINIQKANQQKIELLQRKYRKKISEYKNKIEQYKVKILQLINQPQNKQSSSHEQIKIRQLQKKLISINRQAQKKISEIKTLKQKDKLQMQKKYENKYKQLQSYYQKLLQQKIQQSQKLVYETAQRIKTEEDEIRKYIQFMQQNSIPLQQYSKLGKYCEGLKQHVESKIAESQKITNTLASDNKQLVSEVQQNQKVRKQLNEKNYQLEEQLCQMKTNIKQLNNQLNTLKMNQQKIKVLLTDCEAKLLSKDQQNISLRNQIQRVRSENTQSVGNLCEKQNLLIQKTQQVQLLEKKNAKLAKDFESLSQQLQITQVSISNHKKALTQKQNKIQTITYQNNYKIDTLNSDLHKANITIQNYTQKIKQLVDKNQYLQNEITQNLRQKTQLETNLRKLQLQNKYVKQSEQSYKQQHENYVNDYKKRVQQKNKTIEELNNKISQLNKINTQQHKQKQAKCRRYTQIIKKINRIYSTQINNILRSLKEIKIFLESGQKLFKNEIKIIESNIALKIKQQLFNILDEKNNEIRKIKQALEYEKNQHLDSTRTKSQKLQISFRQKIENQSRNFQSTIEAKEKQIQRLEKEKKKLYLQKDQLIDANRLLQKKNKDLELILQNQKIQSKSKINELIRTFDTQKQKIIRQYIDKRDKKEEQMDELLKNMKTIRKELDNSKIHYDEQKNKWNEQLNLHLSKQKTLQIQLQKKKLEVENLHKWSKDYKQHFAKIESQMKLINEQNRLISSKLAQSQFKNHQISGQLLIIKTKAQRLQQENQNIKKENAQRNQEKLILEDTKRKLQFELKQIKLTINKTNKSHELRALQQLDIETKELSSKVNQLKKVNILMSNDRTPLRS